MKCTQINASHEVGGSKGVKPILYKACTSTSLYFVIMTDEVAEK